MTQDYRKRAEELLKRFHRDCYCAHEEQILVNSFQQIAQEARRECLFEAEKIACQDVLNDEWHAGYIVGAKEVAKAIRARMIGPEPMEEK